MKSLWLVSSMLAVSLVIGAPSPGFAHVGHGDEFQAEGGINRVAVNAQTDSLMGIEVNPIKPAPNGSAAVLIPVTALVDDAGKQLVFVQYENFYEPVPVATGATQGELIEVTQGLSVGENLVTQGSLSLYAESRKNQTADAAPSPAAVASPKTDATHAQADAQGIPHSHDAAGNLVQSGGMASPSSEAAQQTSETSPSQGLPMGMLASIGGGAILLVGALAFGSRKKKNTSSNK